MRVWLAGLFVMVGIYLAFILMADRVSMFLIVPVLVVLLFVLSLVALILFNLMPEKGNMQDTNPPMDFALQMKEWEAKGMLITEEFQATRAFSVEEAGEEGPHFFLELNDGSVIYLNGQYLYDENIGSEDVDDDSAEEIPLFPCTEFTITRHRQEGWVVELISQGQLLDFETLPSSFWESDYWNNRADFSAQDGERITNMTYDQIKNASQPIP